MTVPEELVARWEKAYRHYDVALRAKTPASSTGEQASACVIAGSSEEVAQAWREMERHPGLPWWLLAALAAGAQAFEVQAREWDIRAGYSSPSSVAAEPPRLAVRAQPGHEWGRGVGEADG